MKRVPLVGCLLLLLTALAAADETWCGLYIKNQKIGYAKFTTSEAEYRGKTAQRTETTTLIAAQMLGSGLQIRIETVSYSDASGRPLSMRFVVDSGGRTQTTDATFEGSRVSVAIVNGGQKSTKVLDVPSGARVVEDPTLVVLGSPTGKTETFYLLDPMTVSLIKNEATHAGKATIEVGGVPVQVETVLIKDPRMTQTAYLSAKGDLVKLKSVMGLEMVAEPKEKALAFTAGDLSTLDLATESSIASTPSLDRVDDLRTLDLRLTGLDLSALPSGDHQTVRKDGEAWRVDVHPPALPKRTIPLAEAKRQKPAWTKATTHVPADDPKMVALARDIVRGETDTLAAAIRVRDWVFEHMRPNAGIGVVRDAREVLATKEGVCRDYAILSATLMRAAGVPTRLVAGLTNWNGRFYYHAWVEAWTGKQWIGLDATIPRIQVDPAHVKLSEGNVEEAFSFTFLEGVKIEVLGKQSR
ncbi:MAG: transglutaminase domain-containing protein [Fimbriimonadaceae bacterium]|nr:transglutaminase domain-containing protein [Fimbriimonadaceae bacterium]